MEEAQERWRRPGVRLAVLALIGISIYFLVIFVKQSVNWYQLNQEERAREARVTQLAQENAQLQERLGWYLGEEGRRLLIESNLPYVEPGEQVVVVVAPQGQVTAPAAEPQGDSPEALAALPVWQQWWRVVFTPMNQ
jgi:cell division protein FtsB